MATEPHYIDVDLKRKTQFSTPVVTQNDTDVVFIMRISDDGRTSPDLLDKFSKVTLTSERWDRESFFTLGSKVDGTNGVEFRLGTKELELVGKVTASVQFYSTDGRKSSSHFRYQVEKDLTGEYVPTETEAGLIETVLIDGPEIIGAAQKATQDTIQSLEVFNTDKAESLGELTTTIEENRVEWKPAVATVAERDTKYPNPVNGWTVRVTGETAIYKYSKNAWIKTDQYNPAAVDGLYTQLAETVNKNPIYLTDYKVHPLNTAAQNTGFIQQAILDAEKTNRPIILPWVPDGQWIRINDSLKFNTGGVKITGFGKQSRIQQTVFPKAIFEVRAPNVEIDGVFGSGVAFSGAGLGDTHVTNAVVYIGGGAHNAIARNIKGENISTVINVAAEAGGVATAPLENVTVENIETKDVVFGLLLSGTKNLHFSNIRGHYKLLNNVPTPPHLIYSSSAYGLNTDVQGDTAYSVNGEVSYAYQFKALIGGEINNLYARNSMGLLHVMDSVDTKFKNVSAFEDTWDGLGQASIDLEGINNNITLDNVSTKMIGNGKAIKIGAETSNSRINNIEVETNHSIENTVDDAYDIDIRGTNNIIENVTSKNIGSATWWASIGIWIGVNNKIVSPKTSGNKDGILVRTASNSSGSAIENYSMVDLKNFTRRAISIGMATKLIPKNEVETKNNLLAFDRGDILYGSVGTLTYTTSGHKWLYPVGEYRILNGRIFSSVAIVSAAYVSLETANVELKFGLKYMNREAAAIRVIDRNNYIGARLDHALNLAYVYKCVGGVITRLAEVPFTPQVGRRYEYKLSGFGNVVDFYVDGAKMVSATLDAEATTTFGAIKNHGITTVTSNTGLFDNIEWRSLE